MRKSNQVFAHGLIALTHILAGWRGLDLCTVIVFVKTTFNIGGNACVQRIVRTLKHVNRP